MNLKSKFKLKHYDSSMLQRTGVMSSWALMLAGIAWFWLLAYRANMHMHYFAFPMTGESIMGKALGILLWAVPFAIGLAATYFFPAACTAICIAILYAVLPKATALVLVLPMSVLCIFATMSPAMRGRRALYVLLIGGVAVALAGEFGEFQGLKYAFALLAGAAMVCLLFTSTWFLSTEATESTSFTGPPPSPPAIRSTFTGNTERHSASDGSAGQDDRAQFRSEFAARMPRKEFADLAGMEDLKLRLGDIGRQIQSSMRTKAPRNGVLLFGEPGTGKTDFAEAFAASIGMKVIPVSFGNVASRWVNQSTERVVAMFEAARQAAPVVLFIDEIDAILVDRSKVTNADSESSRLVTTMLDEMVKLRGSGVVLVAATNYLERLDEAGAREGRFDFKIEVPSPDEDARLKIMSDAFGPNLAIVDKPGLARAAKRWNGFSAARLIAIVAEAIAENSRSHARIDFDALRKALRAVQGTTGYQFTAADPTLSSLTYTGELRDKLYCLADMMANIDEIEELGGSVPSGALFYGPGGTGKTITAKALAKTAGWAFLPTTGQDLIRDDHAVDALIKRAKSLRPVVVMIDEADDVFADRRASYAATVTNKLLSVMDGAAGRTADILFIAATNNPDAFDPAALRGGRFTEKIEFALPDVETLAEIVRAWSEERARTVAPDWSPLAVGSLLLGLSHSSAREALQQAANRMVRRRQVPGGLVLNLDDVREGRRAVEGS